MNEKNKEKWSNKQTNKQNIHIDYEERHQYKKKPEKEIFGMTYITGMTNWLVRIFHVFVLKKKFWQLKKWMNEWNVR